MSVHAYIVKLIVRQVSRDEEPLLRRLLELNAYEFSAIDGRDVGPDGVYGYDYLDLYWTEPQQRAALVLEINGAIAGFTLVRIGHPHQISEFFVLPKYRRRGLGTQAAREVLSRWRGEWTTHEVAGNERAVEFWRSAIPVHFTETADAAGTTQHFVIP